MANDHPFQNLFETLGRIPTSHAEPVNRRASEILSDILTVPLDQAGRCILLRAPRAGHGKTHLLSRIQHHLGAGHEFIPLHAAFGSKIDATTVTEDTLRRLVRQLPASGGLTVLDLMARRLFASSLQPLVSSGEVPSEDREGALASLRDRPTETFDFHHPNAITAHWAKKNFELLGQRLSYELAQRSGLPVRQIAFWVEVLFRYSSAPLDSTNRVRLLTESLHTGVGLEMERLEALLSLLALQVRVVLIADDLEGFSADEAAALKLAAFLGALRQSAERVDVILSLNQDIWQSAFLPRLSGGLADRLSEVVVELEPLKEAEMVALLDARAPGLGKRILGNLDRGAAGTHARGLIRAAGMAWLKATATDSTPSSSLPKAESPFPVLEAPISPATPEPAPVIPLLTPVFEATSEPKAIVYQCPPPLPIEEEEAVTKPIFIQEKTNTSEVTPPQPPVGHVKDSGLESDFSPMTEISTPQDPPSEMVGAKSATAPPEFTPEPVAAAFFRTQKPVTEANPSPPVFQLPSDSPFEITPPVQVIVPAANSAVDPFSRPAAANPPQDAADTDRVDNLLRQFRERYGRGSL